MVTMWNWIFNRSPRVCKLGLGLALAVSPLLAHADLWGYVDTDGITHFAESKLDSRYELLFKTLPEMSSKAGATKGKAAQVSQPLEIHPAVEASARRVAQRVERSSTVKSYANLVRQEAARNGLDPALVKAVITAESGFNSSVMSEAGAVGLMQIMPATAQDLGLRADAERSVAQKLTDPHTNVRLGTRYLRYLINMFPGRLELALAAYNAGHGAVKRSGNQIPRYTETQNYVRKVLAIYQQLQPGSAGRITYAVATTGKGGGRISNSGRVQKTFAQAPRTVARQSAAPKVTALMDSDVVLPEEGLNLAP